MLILLLVWLCGFGLGVLVGLILGVRERTRIATAIVTDLRPVVAQAAAPGSPTCGICGLPASALRTHDGHYRCAAHKGQ